MWDSESDFLYRYDWERGERELKLAKRHRLREGFLGLIFPWFRKQDFKGHRWANVVVVAIAGLIVVSMGFTVVSMNQKGSSLKDASSRLVALETNYDVNMTQVWDSEGVDKPLQVDVFYNDSKIHCGLPVLSELESKQNLRCANGVTIPPK